MFSGKIGPMRTATKVVEPVTDEKQQGHYLLILPPDCPELNLIEILWRKIKYEGLPFSADQSFKDLSGALDEVLRGAGSKNRLNFAP